MKTEAVKTSVEVTARFVDRENNKLERRPGDIYETTPERAKYLQALNFVKIISKNEKKD